MMKSQRFSGRQHPDNESGHAAEAPYAHNLDHLNDELHRLDLYLRRAIHSFRAQKSPVKPSEFHGYYISDEEIERILVRADRSEAPDIQPLTAAISKHTHRIEQRVAATGQSGPVLRLCRLSDSFALTELERNLILLTLAPEIDSNYQTLYAYLQDDLTCRLPTIELAGRLFCSTPGKQTRLRKVLSAAHPLLHNYLLTIIPRPNAAMRSPRDNALRLDERIVTFLCGLDDLDDRLVRDTPVAHWADSPSASHTLTLDPETSQTLSGVIRLALSGEPWLCHLQGTHSADSLIAAQALCARLGRPLLVFDVLAARETNLPLVVTLRLTLREAALYGAIVYIGDWMDFESPNPNERPDVRVLEEELNAWCLPAIIAGSKPWQPQLGSPYRFAAIRLPVPDEALRYRIWRRYLNRHPGLNDEQVIERLAGAFRLTERQIRRATTHAQTLAIMRPNGDTDVSHEDLVEACRVESSRKLVRLALRVTPRRRWADLIVPADIRLQLEDFCRQVRRRMTVYNNWGFADKLSLGRATVALFTGCSGVGKTLAAEVVAHELGKDLYKVDLAAVVSKYIGETEKNLDSVFAEAQDGSALLFFDECDALFGKRTEIKDAHDKYANTESNFLLAKLEEFEGDVIMATNMSGNIDPAFRRRIRLLVDFPFPDASLRKRIWEGVFPPRAPLADDVNFDVLAANFRITGGNIRNVALAAAFRAAEKGKLIGMRDIILSMKREYRKIGKICDRADFGSFLDITE